MEAFDCTSCKTTLKLYLSIFFLLLKYNVLSMFSVICFTLFTGILQCHCGKKYYSRVGLRLHQRKHSQQYPFKCDFCSKGFSAKRELNEHLSRHTGKPIGTCDICGFKATSYSGLRGHMNRHKL